MPVNALGEHSGKECGCQLASWLTELSRSGSVLPPAPRHGAQAYRCWEGGAGCWGECSAGRLLRAPAGPAGGRGRGGLAALNNGCWRPGAAAAPAGISSRRCWNQVETPMPQRQAVPCCADSAQPRGDSVRPRGLYKHAPAAAGRLGGAINARPGTPSTALEQIEAASPSRATR